MLVSLIGPWDCKRKLNDLTSELFRGIKMNLAKLCFVTIALSLAMSCDVKDNKSLEEQIESNTFKLVNDDVDYDGIENTLDREPFRTTFPKIELIDFESFAVSYRFNDQVDFFRSSLKYKKFDRDFLNSKKQRFLKYKLIKLHYKKSVQFNDGFDEEDRVDLNDLNYHFVKTQSTQFFDAVIRNLEEDEENFKEDSGEILISFKIKIQNIVKVHQIENVIVSFKLFDREGQTFDDLGKVILKDSRYKNVVFNTTDGQDYIGDQVYSLSIGSLGFSNLERVLNPNNDILVKIEDFDYKIEGKTFNYKAQAEKAKQHLLNFVMFDGEKVSQEYLLNQSGVQNVADTMNLEIDFIDEYRFETKLRRNTLFYPFSLNRLSSDQLTSGLWEFIGIGDLDYNLTGSKDLYFIFARGFELLNYAGGAFQSKIFEKSGQKTFELKGILPDQIIEIEIEGFYDFYKKAQRDFQGECQYGSGRFSEWGICTLSKAVQSKEPRKQLIFQSEAPEFSINFNQAIKYKDHFVELVEMKGNKVKARFQIPSEFIDLEETSLPIPVDISLFNHPDFFSGVKELPVFLNKKSDAMSGAYSPRSIPTHIKLGQENIFKIKYKTFGINNNQ